MHFIYKDFLIRCPYIVIYVQLSSKLLSFLSWQIIIINADYMIYSLAFLLLYNRAVGDLISPLVAEIGVGAVCIKVGTDRTTHSMTSYCGSHVIFDETPTPPRKCYWSFPRKLFVLSQKNPCRTSILLDIGLYDFCRISYSAKITAFDILYSHYIPSGVINRLKVSKIQV